MEAGRAVRLSVNWPWVRILNDHHCASGTVRAGLRLLEQEETKLNLLHQALSESQLNR